MKGQDRLIAFVIVAVFVLLTWLIGNHQNDGPFLLLFWWYWQYIPSNMAFVLIAFVAVAILWRLFPMLKKRELGDFKVSKIVGTFCGLSVLSPFITALINYSWARITGDPPLGFMGVIEEYNSANNVDLNNGILIIGFVILITIIFVVVGRRKE